MAELNINVSANTRDAERNLQNVRTDLNNVQSSANSASTSTNGLERSVDNASSTARSASRSFSTLFSDISRGANTASRAVRSSFSNIRDIAGGILVSLGIENILNSIDSLTTAAIDNANNLTDAGDVLNHYYRDSLDDLMNWATESAKIYGMTADEALTYVGDFTNTLRNFNVASEEQLAEMAVNMTKLSGDMAAQFGDDTSKVQQSLYNAITTGSAKALKDYGIMLTEANLNNYLLSQGIDASYKSLTQQEQGLVRYAYVMKEAQFVQGEFNADINTWAASISTVQRDIQSLLTLIGQYAIPILHPIVNLIGMGVAYAKAFVIELGNVFGWERYVTQASEDTLAPMQSMTDLAGDTADSSAKTTNNVKKLNTELKKGSKLLDLYTVDFASTAESSQSSALPDAQGTIADIQSLLDGVKYADVESNWLPDFDINTDKVKDAVKWVKNLWDWATKTFNDVWNFKLGDLPSLNELFNDTIEKFKNDPGDIALDIIGLIFATSTIKRAAGLVSTYLGDVFNDKSLLTNPTLKTKLTGIGIGISGLIIAGMGGFNLGQAIYNDNDEDALVGRIESIGGVLMTTFGGLMAAGPAGAVLGLGVGLASTFVGAYIGEIEARRNDILSSTDSLLRGDISLLSYYKQELDAIFGDTSVLTNAYATYQQASSDLNGTLRQLTDTEIPAALAALNEDPGELNADRVKKAYGEAADTIKRVADEESKFSTAVLQEQLKEADGTLSPFNDNLLKTLDLLSQLNAERKANDLNRLAELEVLSARGEASEADIAELESLRARYNTVKELAADLPNLIKPFDASKQSYEEWAKSAEDAWNITVDAYEDKLGDLKEALDNGFITQEQYEAGILALKKNLDEIAKTASRSAGNVEADVALKLQFTTTAAAINANFDENLKRVQRDLESQDNAFALNVDFIPKANYTSFEDIPKEALEKLVAAFGLNVNDPNFKQTAANVYEMVVDHFTGSVPIDFAAGTISIDDKSLLGIPDETDRLVTQHWKDAGYSYIDNNGQHVLLLPEGPTFALPETDVKLSADTLNLSDTELATAVANMYDSIKKKTEEQANADKISEGVENAGKKVNTDNGTAAVADDFSSGLESDLESDENIKKVTDGITANLEGATDTEDAKSRGSALGTAYIEGLAAAINNGNLAGSPYRTALDGMVSAFKDALKNIGENINIFAHTLSSEVSNLGITDNITFSNLLSVIKTRGATFNAIPKLANGAVIPPNNPFLAVLGDQRSGYNIEAPLNIIQQAVASETKTPEVTVQNTVYIGNSELKDYIVDTVIDSNLTTG